MSTFVTKTRVAADAFTTTTARFIKLYLINSVLNRAAQADEVRAKGTKGGTERYIPLVGSVKISFKSSENGFIVKKSSRYMAGRLNNLSAIEQTREVHVTPNSTGVQYSCLLDLKDECGRKISNLIAAKEVATFLHEKDRSKVDVDLLEEVAADIFSFLYSQRPEDTVVKELRLQQEA